MLRRIQWTSAAANSGNMEIDGGDNEIDEVKESTDLKCHLVWEGVSTKPIFDKF